MVIGESNTASNIYDVAKRVVEDLPKWLVAFDLFVSGYTYSEIAEHIYGSREKRAVNRVKQLLRFARMRLGIRFARLVDAKKQRVNCEFAELYSAGGNVVIKKRSLRDRFKRQLLEHEQLIYYIVRRAGFKIWSELFPIAKSYHYRLFPIAWKKWGEKLRCWRNGRGKVPFSFTLHSLAYASALVRAVLILYGYNYPIDEIIREMLPTSKHVRLIEFNNVFAEVGGWVLGTILHPQL